MTIADLRSIPLVFVDDLAVPVVDEHDLHHLTRSLRVRPGAEIAVSDGNGGWRIGYLGDDGTTGLGPIARSENPPLTAVGFALAKGDRSELIVQKLTELGIGTVVPLTTERTVVKWDAKKAAKNHERHRRIAREAAMQSRNVWIPDVRSVASLPDVVAEFPQAVLAEPGGHDLSLMRSNDAQNSSEEPITHILVGPEGGFSSAELSGRRQVCLPGNILRTETAAITAGVLLASTAHRG